MLGAFHLARAAASIMLATGAGWAFTPSYGGSRGWSGPVPPSARLARPAPDASDPPWRWPVPPPRRVVRPFTPPATPWGAGHRGVDLAASPGATVRAAAPGLIAFAGRVAGTGVIVISHGRLRTTYLPVDPAVRAGDRVEGGAPIGRTARRPARHCGPVPCLHWGLRDGIVYRDPSRLPGLHRPVRLLPVWPQP